MRSLARVPTSQHGTHSTYIPQDIHSCQYVFVRRDGYRSALQHPYEGPFKVLSPGGKVFILDRGGKRDFVAIDRLKPAHVDLDQPVRVAIPKPRCRPKQKPPTPPPQNTIVQTPDAEAVASRPRQLNNYPQRRRRQPERYQCQI